jgi:nickel/cobalt transporter (NicO) family protein
MTFDSLFFVALQSSFVLGIVHGINPCGHSWLVLAPLVIGEKNGRKVSFLTVSFLAGTTLACMLIGLTLGAVSLALPDWLGDWVDIITVGVLILLGIVLIIKPSAIHHHGHDHEHDHGHDCACSHGSKDDSLGPNQKLTGLAMFSIGFFNMIVPCPTAAIMYGYALDSQHTIKAFSVFTLYAIATGIAVSAVIFLIFRISSMITALSKEWVESALMRFAGVLTLFFGVYSLYSARLF